LYMSEISALTRSDSALQRMAYIEGFIDRLLVEDIGPVIHAIDSGQFDNFKLVNGTWVTADEQ